MEEKIEFENKRRNILIILCMLISLIYVFSMFEVYDLGVNNGINLICKDKSIFYDAITEDYYCDTTPNTNNKVLNITFDEVKR